MSVDAPLNVTPGKLLPLSGNVELNTGRRTAQLDVTSTCDRPIQVILLTPVTIQWY